MKRSFTMVCKRLDLSKSKPLYKFNTFDPKDWTIVKGSPKWSVGRRSIIGGSPDEPTHGQIFFKKPVKGDVVLEFDAKIVSPSYHDLVWFWNTDFKGDPWGDGYLGCLGGWWDDMAISASASMRAAPSIRTSRSGVLRGPISASASTCPARNAVQRRRMPFATSATATSPVARRREVLVSARLSERVRSRHA